VALAFGLLPPILGLQNMSALTINIGTESGEKDRSVTRFNFAESVKRITNYFKTDDDALEPDFTSVSATSPMAKDAAQMIAASTPTAEDATQFCVEIVDEELPGVKRASPNASDSEGESEVIIVAEKFMVEVVPIEAGKEEDVKKRVTLPCGRRKGCEKGHGHLRNCITKSVGDMNRIEMSSRFSGWRVDHYYDGQGCGRWKIWDDGAVCYDNVLIAQEAMDTVVAVKKGPIEEEEMKKKKLKGFKKFRRDMADKSVKVFGCLFELLA
jgi:hypothetical protein